jgi:hypothetical protein
VKQLLHPERKPKAWWAFACPGRQARVKRWHDNGKHYPFCDYWQMWRNGWW